MKSKYATTCMEALKKMIKVKQPKKVWVDQGTEFKGSFKILCEKKGIELYTTHSEKKIGICRAKYQIIENHNLQIPRGQMDILLYNKATRYCEHY